MSRFRKDYDQIQDNELAQAAGLALGDAWDKGYMAKAHQLACLGSQGKHRHNDKEFRMLEDQIRAAFKLGQMRDAGRKPRPWSQL